MNPEEKAKQLGINPEGKDQTDLIHAIQEREGFQKCFGHGMFTCSNLECCWRDKCLGICANIIFDVKE